MDSAPARKAGKVKTLLFMTLILLLGIALIVVVRAIMSTVELDNQDASTNIDASSSGSFESPAKTNTSPIPSSNGTAPGGNSSILSNQ